MWNKSSSVEESRPDFLNFEILLNSTFLHVPANNLDYLISLIPNFDLMEPIAIPVISLSDISAVEIVLDIVMMAKVIGGIDEASSEHYQYLLNKIIFDMFNTNK